MKCCFSLLFFPRPLTPSPLPPAAPSAASPAAKNWFRPELHLPDIPVVPLPAGGASGGTDLPLLRGSLKETAAGVRTAYPDLPETLVGYYTVMMHSVEGLAAGDEGSAAAGVLERRAAEVRELLLPGVPLPGEGLLEGQQEEEAEAVAAVGAEPAAAAPQVGSWGGGACLGWMGGWLE